MSKPEVTVGTFAMPFRIVFKHTSAARAATENVVVQLRDDNVVGYGEGCPRHYVTGETTESARSYLQRCAPSVVDEVDTVQGLQQWIEAHRDDIDKNPAAFCALELAMLDLLARRAGTSVEVLLGRPELSGPFQYSAVLGDSGPLTYGAQLVRYRIGGLRHYKLKLSGDLKRDRMKVRWFKGRLGGLVADSVRVDANNLWQRPEEASAHIEAMGQPLLGIEEPLAAGRLDGFLEIAESTDSPIILDESLLRAGQVADLPGRPEQWILNCRISKSGGLLRSLELIDAARSAGLGIIVGAHVGETSLLSRAALTAAVAAGPSLLAQEGAFGTNLLSSDLCAEPLMFGPGGRLGSEQLDHLGAEGFGIDVLAERLSFDKS